MINPEEIDSELDALGLLLREKLSIRGRTFEAQLRKAGRWLPRRVHRAGRVLIRAQGHAQHPKLARLNAGPEMAQAIATIREYLSSIDAAERRKTRFMRELAALLFNLIVLLALVILLVYWRGLS